MEILQPKSLRLRAIMTRQTRLFSTFCAKPASSANARQSDSIAACAALESDMTHIAGFERSQLLLLPEAIDDYVVADNPVRFIDAFVDGLILRVSCTICGIILCEPGRAQARAL